MHCTKSSHGHQNLTKCWFWCEMFPQTHSPLQHQPPKLEAFESSSTEDFTVAVTSVGANQHHDNTISCVGAAVWRWRPSEIERCLAKNVHHATVMLRAERLMGNLGGWRSSQSPAILCSSEFCMLFSSPTLLTSRAVIKPDLLKANPFVMSP